MLVATMSRVSQGQPGPFSLQKNIAYNEREEPRIGMNTRKEMQREPLAL